MTLTIKNLGNGQLPNTTGDLYTVPAATSAIVKSIIITNTNTTTEYFTIYFLKTSGTARAITPVSFALYANASYPITELITLAANDKIQGVTTTASKVDFTISGVEIT